MVRPAFLVLALAASSLAWGQEAADAPARFARLSYVEGPVTFRAGDALPSSSLPDRPLESGDRIVTRNGGRAELAFGTATIRLDEESELAITDLGEADVRVELIAGSASVTLRDLLEDESFEIATPNAGIALIEPGEFRVDVRAED